jgi:hypothetical protein
MLRSEEIGSLHVIAHIHECDCYHEKMIVCRGIGPNSVDSERFLVLASKVLTEENRA